MLRPPGRCITSTSSRTAGPTSTTSTGPTDSSRSWRSQSSSNSHGVVASPGNGILYVSYGGQGGSSGSGSLLAYDLLARRVLWTRSYTTGIDSLGITPDGRTIYMPDGESSESTFWRVIQASTGKVTGAISAGSKPHNTIVARNGMYVYLGGCGSPYLTVVRTATNKVVRKDRSARRSGCPPVHGQRIEHACLHDDPQPSRLPGRGELPRGRCSTRSPRPVSRSTPHVFGETSTPNHGISLSPDERELYLIDTPNGYVHVFDVSGLPGSAPRKVASIKMAHPPPNDGWLQHSRDGHYVYVGRAGDVIDTRTR